MRLAVATAALAVVSTALAGWPADAAAQEADEVVAFVGGEVRTAAGDPIPGGVVLVRGGLVEDVGAGLDVPAGARIVDCAGRVVTPGFIDADSSLATTALDAAGAVPGADVRAVDGFDPWDERLRTARRQGVTALHVPGNREQLIGGLTAVVATAPLDGAVDALEQSGALVVNLSGSSRAGGLWGATRVAGARGLFVSARNRVAEMERWRKDLTRYEEQRLADEVTEEERLLLPPEVIETMRLWSPAQRAAWREAAYKSMKRAKEYEKPKKPAAAPKDPRADPNLETIVGALAPPATDDAAAGRPARRTFVRAELGRDTAAALTLAGDFGLDAVVAGGEGLRERARDLVDRRAPVVLTRGARTTAAPGSIDARRSRGLAAALVAAGLRPALGSGGAGASRFLRLLAAREIGEGLAPADALRAVTIWAAESAGVADRAGTLEPGKRADIVVWSGDPFAAATRAEMVFIRGRRVDE